MKRTVSGAKRPVHSAPFQYALGTALALCLSPAWGQVEALTTAVAIERAEGVLSGITKNAAAEANLVVFNAATEARLLLIEWRRQNEALLDSGFDRADQAVKSLVDKASLLKAGLDQSGEQINQAAAQLLDSAQQVAETITLTGEPTLRRLSPVYIVPALNMPFEIVIAGVNLDEAEDISLSGSEFGTLAPTNSTQLSMNFQLPASIRRSPEPTTLYLDAVLKWTQPHPSWYRRWFGSRVEISHKIQFLRLPKDLAEVEVSYATQYTERETQVHQQQFYHRRGGRYNSETCQVVPIRPHEGFKIDVSSLERISDTGAYGRFSVEGLTPEGFAGRSCAKSRSRSGYKDTTVRWTEYREIQKASERTAGRVEKLSWNQDLVIRLPLNAIAPILKARIFDGRILAFSGDRDDGFMRAVFDPAARTFILSPVPQRYHIE